MVDWRDENSSNYDELHRLTVVCDTLLKFSDEKLAKPFIDMTDEEFEEWFISLKSKEISLFYNQDPILRKKVEIFYEKVKKTRDETKKQLENIFGD